MNNNETTLKNEEILEKRKKIENIEENEKDISLKRINAATNLIRNLLKSENKFNKAIEDIGINKNIPTEIKDVFKTLNDIVEKNELDSQVINDLTKYLNNINKSYKNVDKENQEDLQKNDPKEEKIDENLQKNDPKEEKTDENLQKSLSLIKETFDQFNNLIKKD